MKWDAEQYDNVRAPQADAGRELIEMSKVKEDDSILDLGCGTGTLTVELARLAHRGRVFGIDPSAEMIERARQTTALLNNISLFEIPAQAAEFRGEFDLVFSNSAFQWIKEQENVIIQAYRALKQDGRIAMQMPAKDFCWTMTENIHSAVSALGLESKYRKMESPWRFPLKEEMRDYLKNAGFKNINVFSRDYALLFDSVNEVLAWGVSAGLRPFLAPLSARKQERFKYAFAMGFESYRTERGIEFSFKRMFALAEK